MTKNAYVGKGYLEDDWARRLIFRATTYLEEFGGGTTKENVLREAIRLKVESGAEGYVGELREVFHDFLDKGSIVEDKGKEEGHYKWRDCNLF